jgi:HSP20 family protein
MKCGSARVGENCEPDDAEVKIMPNIPIPRNIPFSVQEIRNEFDKLLDRVWHGGLSTAPLDGQDWAPCLDVLEEPDAYRVYVELPGVPADAVDVAILNNALTIRGTKQPSFKADEDRRALRTECPHGGFCRKYELPGPVRDEGVSATYRNGVLEVVIPKSPEVMGSKIKINVQE